ncbi:hypothetical protein FOA52_014969 [Chlamydomonas sp. UWO 241]|nr:hypothetical protein FOA52_014969 [Chlamydomonas sp. UWO 241]
MFASLKEKLVDKLRSWEADELDVKIMGKVNAGTNEELIAPEWSVNLAIVDMVNQSPTVMSEKLCKALRYVVVKHNPKCQLLALTILETCIKNCHPAIYGTLIKSELWVDMVKMVADRGVNRVDGEVRDKILCMVEDYAKVLPQAEYRETVDTLLEHGVDFPARSPDDQPPILTPPPAYTAPTMVPLGALAELPPGMQQQQQQGRGRAADTVDPFAGMSAEDRAAVQAAIAEADAEAAAFDESAAIAQPAPPPPSPRGAPPLPSVPEQPESAMALAAAAAAVMPAESAEETLATVFNARGLLDEMLGGGADPREGFVAELAQQCVDMRSKLEEMIGSVSDEGQMVAALAAHESLQATLSTYDGALAAAESAGAREPFAAGAATAPFAAAAAPGGVSDPLSPGDGFGAGSPSAGPNFTLLDEEDEAEVEEELMLASARGGGGGGGRSGPVSPAAASLVPAPMPAPMPAPESAPEPMPESAPEVVAAAAGVSAAVPDPLDDLFGGDAAAVPAPAAAAPAPVGNIVPMDDLLDGLAADELLAPAVAPAPVGNVVPMGDLLDEPTADEPSAAAPAEHIAQQGGLTDDSLAPVAAAAAAADEPPLKEEGL